MARPSPSAPAAAHVVDAPDDTVYRFLTRGLKVRADERRPFFWTLTFFILVFLVMGIFRSYVDTEFLQHYGASQVPVMLLINGVLTIAVFWIVGLRKTAPDSSLVAWFLILPAVATGALFFWVLSGSSGPYPLLYQLLNLQDSFFLVYLWNVAGALFDVRQGKRLFPLLMAGQVFGTAVGSFLVVPLAGIAGSDYLLTVVAAGYACVGVGLLGAGSILSPRTKRRREDQESTDKRPAEILALIRKYPIIRYLVASAFFPGFLLPIFTYQFFVIAHTTFPAEQSLLAFLSVFRGVVTLATFLLLFAVGGFYAKVGLARAAFVQPVNFFVVFAGLAASFGIAMASYGQFSVIFLQRAVAGPMNKVFVNAVPRRLYAWTRVFTAGTVVNAAVVLSTLAMVLLQKDISAHEMAYAAVAISLLWISETIVFRRRFTRGLRQVLEDRAVDYEGLEAERNLALAGHDRLPLAAGRDPAAASGSSAARAAAEDSLADDPETALALLDDRDAAVRARAATALASRRDARGLTALLSPLREDSVVHRATVEALAGYVPHFRAYLEIALLDAPRPRQQAILEAMKAAEDTGIPVAFVRTETAHVCQRLQFIECLEAAATCLSLRLLTEHLREENDESVRLIFHAMALHLTDARLILESLHTSKAAVAIELLEDTLSKDLAHLVLLLVDEVPAKERIESGKDLLVLRPPLTLVHVACYLASAADPTTRMLAAFVIGELAPDDVCQPAVQALADDPHEHVREAAAYAVTMITRGGAVLPDIVFDIHALQKMSLFESVSVRALESIASSMQQKFFKPGATVLAEGEAPADVFCIINGAVDALRGHGTPAETRIASLADGDVFGELPLLTGHSSRESYVVTSDYIELYILDYDHMRDLMALYPTIAVNLGRSLALRLEER